MLVFKKNKKSKEESENGGKKETVKEIDVKEVESVPIMENEELFNKVILCINNNVSGILSSCEIFKINEKSRVELIMSPLLSNLEYVMKLYNKINKYKKETDDKNKIQIAKQLEYLLLTLMMKQIAIISDRIKTESQEMKNSIVKYGIIVSYQLSLLINDELEQKTINYISLQEDIVQLSKIKISLLQKISLLSETIKQQNVELESLRNKIDTYSQK